MSGQMKTSTINLKPNTSKSTTSTKVTTSAKAPVSTKLSTPVITNLPTKIAAGKPTPAKTSPSSTKETATAKRLNKIYLNPTQTHDLIRLLACQTDIPAPLDFQPECIFDERARISNKEGDTLFNLAVIVGFIQDLAPAISIPSLSRKKGQMFVSRFGELEAELNALKDQVDLREFAVPIDNLLEPGVAEEALRSLDKFIVAKVGTKIGFLYQDTLADCLEDLERQYQQVKEKMEKKEEPIPPHATTAESKEVLIEQRKQREKTPGTPSSVYEITPHAPTAIAPAEPPAKPFKVSKAAVDVFHTLFNSTENRGTLNWSAFVGAMTELGFSVLPRFGSVYNFYPPMTMEVKRPITLHRPHGSEIGRHLILAFAQRLKRVYGWNADSFGV